jgi:hypothetical protein
VAEAKADLEGQWMAAMSEVQRENSALVAALEREVGTAHRAYEVDLVAERGKHSAALQRAVAEVAASAKAELDAALAAAASEREAVETAILQATADIAAKLKAQHREQMAEVSQKQKAMHDTQLDVVRRESVAAVRGEVTAAFASDAEKHAADIAAAKSSRCRASSGAGHSTPGAHGEGGRHDVRRCRHVCQAQV